MLGICYGAQLMAYELGGKVLHADVSEYGHTEVKVAKSGRILRDWKRTSTVWMSHTDRISEVPEGFEVLASVPSGSRSYGRGFEAVPCIRV